MLKRSHALFLASTLVTATLFTAATASAWETRRSGAACTAGTSFGTNNNWGITGTNTSSSGSLSFACPIADESDLMHNNITTLNIHLDVPASLGSAFRCVSFFNATGGNCGTSVNTSGTGTPMVSPPNTPSSFANNWNNAAHFAYVQIVVPPNGAIKGYYTAN
jgi:hypothetical protein